MRRLLCRFHRKVVHIHALFSISADTCFERRVDHRMRILQLIVLDTKLVPCTDARQLRRIRRASPRRVQRAQTHIPCIFCGHAHAYRAWQCCLCVKYLVIVVVVHEDELHVQRRCSALARYDKARAECMHIRDMHALCFCTCRHLGQHTWNRGCHGVRTHTQHRAPRVHRPVHSQSDPLGTWARHEKCKQVNLRADIGGRRSQVRWRISSAWHRRGHMQHTLVIAHGVGK